VQLYTQPYSRHNLRVTVTGDLLLNQGNGLKVGRYRFIVFSDYPCTQIVHRLRIHSSGHEDLQYHHGTVRVDLIDYIYCICILCILNMCLKSGFLGRLSIGAKI
jgi:hypothetical protein